MAGKDRRLIALFGNCRASPARRLFIPSHLALVRNIPYNRAQRVEAAMLIEEKSTLTAKGQTTVPKAVRQALGIRSGDRIAFRVDEKGRVSMARDTGPDDDTSAVDAFLAFLSDDIKRRPQAVTPLSEKAAARMRALADGVEADPDGDFGGAAPL
jgi:antitoxin PrlF